MSIPTRIPYFSILGIVSFCLLLFCAFKETQNNRLMKNSKVSLFFIDNGISIYLYFFYPIIASLIFQGNVYIFKFCAESTGPIDVYVFSVIHKHKLIYIGNSIVASAYSVYKTVFCSVRVYV